MLVERLCPTLFRKSWKKAELVRVALEGIDPETLSIPERFVAQGRRDALGYLLYLFFGRIEDNLQVFTLADLGLAESPESGDTAESRFDTSEEARVAFFYARAAHDFRHGGDADAARLIAARGDCRNPSATRARRGAIGSSRSSAAGRNGAGRSARRSRSTPRRAPHPATSARCASATAATRGRTGRGCARGSRR